MAQRSTKGASKQRRDAINERVTQIRELLPVSEAARSRLSQLQVMALARSFIAKSNLFNQVGGMIDDRKTTWCDHFDFLQAVPGFLMIFGLDGKILYISDNVCDYLGNSAVDIVTQTETLYELVDERDHAIVRDAMNPGSSDPSQMNSELLQSSSPSSSFSSSLNQSAAVVSFVCRMNTAARSVRYAPAPIKSGFERFRTMQVRGRRLATSDISTALHGHLAAVGTMTGAASGIWRASTPSESAFVVACTPSLSAADVLSMSLLDGGAVAWDTTVFRSQHDIDMKFISVDANGEYQLGYEREAISGKSWYEIVHPDDIAEASFKHVDLMQSTEMSAWRSLCVRVQSGRGDVIWLHVVMRLCDVTFDDVTTRRIVCINQLIDENEARVIRANAMHDDVSTHLDIDLLRGPHGFLDGLFDDGRHSVRTKRRVTAADNWAASCSPPKIARQTEIMFDDAYHDAYLMSVPSPPFSYGSNLTGQDLAAGGDLQISAGSMLSFPSYPTGSIDGFLSVKSDEPYIPDSFLTPKASPCSFTYSSSPVHQPMTELNVEELSFFDQVAHHDQSIKSSVVINDDKLPVLDLPTVTSYLHCLEQAEALPQTAPVSGQMGGRLPVSVECSRALPLTVDVGAALLQEKTSTVDEELLQNLFSTANTFLSSVTAVKPFEFGSQDLLFAHC